MDQTSPPLVLIRTLYGARFNIDVVQYSGQIIHFTGQVASDKIEWIIGRGGVEAQTRQCFENILAVLNSVGGTDAGCRCSL